MLQLRARSGHSLQVRCFERESEGREAELTSTRSPTVPDFEERASMVLNLAAIMSLTLLPLVTEEHLVDWVKYSISEQGWLNESLEHQKSTGFHYSKEDEDVLRMDAILGNHTGIEDGLWRVGGNRTHLNASVDQGPYLPWWQYAPGKFKAILELEVLVGR